MGSCLKDGDNYITRRFAIWALRSIILRRFSQGALDGHDMKWSWRGAIRVKGKQSEVLKGREKLEDPDVDGWTILEFI